METPYRTNPGAELAPVLVQDLPPREAEAVQLSGVGEANQVGRIHPVRPLNDSHCPCQSPNRGQSESPRRLGLGSTLVGGGLGFRVLSPLVRPLGLPFGLQADEWAIAVLHRRLAKCW